ncbi:hypothetical protein [Deinococcus sonorensis]|uniref:Uncharacterized protein n=2 Tax=Deinococcus sonorensis TaxID=309891 RepID=A0AAU7U8R0_9DEIO
MLGLLALMLLLLNVGGLASLGLSLGHGQWGSSLSTLLMLGLLDALGFWLLRSLRER